MDLDQVLVDMFNGSIQSLLSLQEISSMAESMSTQAARWTINPQDSCPLFAHFPPEIRQNIFSHALAEHDSHSDIQGRPGVRFLVPEPKWLVCDLPTNTSKPMPEHSSLEGVDIKYYSPQKESVGEFYRKFPLWLRSGTSAVRFQHTSLLRTCRRVFLEARDLLMKNATLRIFATHCVLTDEMPRKVQNVGVAVHSIRHMTRYTANRLTALEVYIGQAQLEYAFISRFGKNDNLRCIEDLRITLRKDDWRYGTEKFGPQLTPYGDGRDSERADNRQLMKKHMELEGEHEQDRAPIPPIPYTRQQYGDGKPTWGESLSLIPNLKRFTMNFEYSEDQFQKLKELSEWAQRVWTFRLGGKMKGYYLSAKDNPIKLYSWRGLTTHMGEGIICPNEDCPQKSKDSDEDDLDDPEDPDEDSLYDVERPECCVKAYERMGHGFGPRMYTFTVTWTAKKLEPEDGDDPEIFGPDELVSKWPEVRRDSLVPPIDWAAIALDPAVFYGGIPPAIPGHRLLDHEEN